MALIFGGFIGFLLLIILIFYILKLSSITLFLIPGSENAFHFFITIIPYAIFFSGYYYLHTKITFAKTKLSRYLSRFLLVTGSALCLITMLLSLLVLYKVKTEWLRAFDDNTHFALIAQILLLFFTAAIIATGDPKEKNWMEKDSAGL